MTQPFRPPPPVPPDTGPIPEWMLGDDELSQRIVLMMRVRITENIVLQSEPRLPNDHFLIGNAITLALGSTDAAKVEASKEARGARYILRTKNKSIVTKLMQIRELPDKTPVEVIEHPTLNTVQGVVFEPDSVDLSKEYICRNLESQGVCDARHITKRDGNQSRNTPLIVLTFKGTILPKYVYFGRLRVGVRIYFPSPMMCFRCANFGHSRKNCDTTKYRQICLTCSGTHELIQGTQCTLPAHCQNCDRAHSPVSKQCPIYLEEEAIIRLKINRGLSFSEARAEYRKEKGNTCLSSVIQGRLRNEEDEKDRTIKLLQEQILSLQKTVVALKAQIDASTSKPVPKNNNGKQNPSKEAGTSKGTNPNAGQSLNKSGTSEITLKDCYVELPRINIDKLAVAKYRKDTIAQVKNKSQNYDDEEQMDFEMVKNNKRKGNKRNTPESPDRKKGYGDGNPTLPKQSPEVPI